MKPFQLKPLSHEAVPNALERAVRYRLLNEPLQAESICRDVLEVEPENEQALKTLILALTDQFVDHLADAFAMAEEIVAKLTSDYERAYYGGIICERRGHAHRKRGGANPDGMAYEWYTEAMQHYEQAEKIRPAGNDESILRWNSCARLLNRDPSLRPAESTSDPLIQLE